MLGFCSRAATRFVLLARGLARFGSGSQQLRNAACFLVLLGTFGCRMSMLDGLSGGKRDAGDQEHDGAPGDGDGQPGPDGSTGDGDGGVPATDGGENDGSVLTKGDEFFSSFETGDVKLNWVDTGELDAKGVAKKMNVAGGRVEGLRGQIAQLAVNGENPPLESAGAAFDGDTQTKWLVFENTARLTLQLTGKAALKRYGITSANDAPERDPRDWTIEGSSDGENWDLLDTRTEQSFSARYQTKTFNVSNNQAYSYYRLNVSANGGGVALVQLSELWLWDTSPNDADASAMSTHVGSGPSSPFNARGLTGYRGLRALRYSGGVAEQARGYATNKIYDVEIPVLPDSELSYLIYPDLTSADSNNPSTYAAVDLAFSDGTYLSDLNALDQHFVALNAAAQGASRTLYPGEWNKKLVKLGEVAEGKTIQRILVAFDCPNGPVAHFGGFIDELRIAKQGAAAPSKLSDYVITTRGTNSGGLYGRGNTIPATALPHGFNFWTPVTDASTDSFLYTYQAQNNADNLPMLQALALSHQPSPWIGDRQSLQIMPWQGTSVPNIGRVERAQPFKHENEVARPYYYGVTFENGVKAEMTPTDHAAMLRFTFPDEHAALIFDGIGPGGLSFDESEKSVSAYSDQKSGSSEGATRIFIYGTFDRSVSASQLKSDSTGFISFDVPKGDFSVTLRIATSLISMDQAKKNLVLEIAANDTFESVRTRAQKTWDDALSVITVEGANQDQLTTLYSNLYRLFLYPNSGFENVGTANAPKYQHASFLLSSGNAATPTDTDAKIVDGKVYVNSGFWDTYRATWPLLTLLTPSQTGEMIDGFLQHYREGGWLSRWSAPGPADLMTGTSADVVLADAYLKGAHNFAIEDAYDAAVKDATVYSANSHVGRHGLDTSVFLGYTPSEENEGFSWAMSGYLSDFAIAKLAEELAKDAGNPRHDQYVADAQYFEQRALSYVNLFDKSVKFFQGRAKAGTFRLSSALYDPRVWGNDYTETNGWNMAFEQVYDGQGLANLYGGRSKLAQKLDLFFSTQETATFPGAYGNTIHEMREARDVRMGMLGLSNQASFHIIYMYLFANQPAKVQAKVRDALARLWVGSEIGQGYLGDDDNGGLAAWQVFGALGFYPLTTGTPSYVIGSPLFTKATVKLENGKSIVINAPKNSAKNVYVQGLKLNGADYTKTYIDHGVLTAGATLEFDMGPSASSWGSAADAAPPSLTTGAAAAVPLSDATKSGASQLNAIPNVTSLFDDNALNSTTFAADNPVVTIRFNAKTPAVELYTLTSSATAGDPSGWTLSGSSDGGTWNVLDTRTNQSFAYRSQTRVFKVANPVAYAYYKLELTASTGTGLAEIELLAK
jgi:predicted alpha-1,2-mannosidase